MDNVVHDSLRVNGASPAIVMGDREDFTLQMLMFSWASLRMSSAGPARACIMMPRPARQAADGPKRNSSTHVSMLRRLTAPDAQASLVQQLY